MCPYVCMYVCTICTSIFHHSIIFRMGSLDFVICFAWSWETISTQNWWSRIFWENYYLPKKGPKWPNLYIFLFLWRFYQNWYVIFFIFCMKLRNHKHSKLKKPNFYGKFLLTQNQAKRAQNGTIFSFVCYNCTFFEDWLISFFWYFVWRWRPQNWCSQISWENSYLCKNRPKRPKMLLFICPLWLHFFLRIGSLDLSHISQKIEGKVLKTEEAKIFWENTCIAENGTELPKMSWFVCLSITARTRFASIYFCNLLIFS